MNVLLTSAGRRNYLVRYFREELDGRGEVYAADASPDAPALAEADRAFVVPRFDSSEYLGALLSICAAHGVRLLVPLNDLELPVLARARDAFNEVGTVPVVSTPDVIDVCLDKWRTFRFLNDAGLQVPRTYLTLSDAEGALERGELGFPVVVKPRWGTASVGIEYPVDRDELALALRLGRSRLARTILGSVSASDPERALLIQELLSGQEYGLDVVNDLSGRHVATFVKRKLAMRAGETDRAVTVRDGDLEAIGRRIGTRLGHTGNLDVDVFVGDRGARVVEMNPRFGGGYPFSHVAGANVPAALLAWLAGTPPREEWLQVNSEVRAAKCDRLVVVRGD